MTEEARYTFSSGSRAEGCIVYDNDSKLHVHHDSCPANGQSNSFDLVRLMRFGHLDEGHRDLPVVSRPSYKAMCEFARSLPEVQAELVGSEFDELPPLTTPEPSDGEPKSGKFQVIPAAEFAVGSPLAWIIKGLLPKAELVVLYGESGAGKSFLTLDLCAAVSRGVDWQELRTAPGRVIYVCAEGAGGFRNRLNAYSRKHEVPLEQLPAVVPSAPNLLEVEEALELTRAIVAHGRADLIVIDTLAATTAGGNENSGEDMGKVLSHCKSIHRATGALVVLIHHSGKDATKGARGWSGLKAAADAEIEVTRKGDYRTATLTKLKDGQDGKQWTFKLKPVVLGMDADGDEISSCVIEHVAPEEAKPAGAEGLGARQKTVLQLAKDMEAEKGDVFISVLLDAMVAQMPLDAGAKRDHRRRHARDALQTLFDRQYLYLHGEDRVSTTPAIQVESTEFEDKAKE